MNRLSKSRSSKEPKKTGFLDLSPEIRNQIYEQLLVDSQAIDIAPPMWKRSARTKDIEYPSHDPEQYPVQLFRLNRQIHHESSSLFYSRNAFQLSILYPLAHYNAYPSSGSFGAANSFAVLGWHFDPLPRIITRSTSARSVWRDRTILRWEYIMPSDALDRDAVERKAKMGRKPTQIYWPAKRYRAFVRKLKVQMHFNDGWMSDMWAIWYDNRSYGGDRLAVRTGLSKLFEGMLQRVEIDVELWLPMWNGWSTNSGRGEDLSAEAYQCLKRVLMALGPLGLAKRLRVSADVGSRKMLSDGDCERLRLEIKTFGRRNDMKPRPRWRY